MDFDGGLEAKITPVIMVGGAGTRLWPISRETMPKQFIAIMDDGLSTFQGTLTRVAGPNFNQPIIVTSNDFRFVVAEQMRSLGVQGEIVLEPERRDSAAAVAVAAVMVEARQAGSLCLVLAGDHVIDDDAAFVQDCTIAASQAATGKIMTIGIVPTFPASGYGYIAAGNALASQNSFVVDRFVEKPDAETAARYVSEGLLWNSGNFLFRSDTMIAEMEQRCSDIIEAASAAVAGGKRDLDFLRLDAESFSSSPKISIDYAIMEKTDRAGVVKASFGWSDIGAWDSVYDVKKHDDAGNVIEGPVSTIGVTNSLVMSDGHLTTVVGLDGVVVVTTPDAVLVASKDQASKVKDLVSQLRTEGFGEATDHLRIHRPWGWYQRIDIGDRFQVKHICVKAGGTLSLQRHYHRAEHWIVVRGTAEVTIDDTVRYYHENEAAYLPIGCVHRLRNPGKIDLRIIEVQVGSYTGEDDIVRLDDVYART
ncbi:mannose-1-phosphate guanylyltransferase/mannose-6-phosphate isomerase [Aureimonas altamirensis]|uniref:mannose-1-phosphate guanylyltransferase/mannose-6-phosphate isomerase n=1 Tax=Aureimonas altamirensis TaxID=370622 RepID=UPI001E2DFFC3|nr:mannose-1-phosphate guanylyltransferase/mannose-6-phosphate isomerase [Aureimonas altamirensis]UHD44570.1 mannose-1-phosphate guanylyltransferase/mannose-6-phosphate isomerase [Aureimonas altamirensis]